MENIIFNELKVRGYNVDVGVVVMNETDQTGKKIRKQLEIDFVCNKGSKRYYIQSAFPVQPRIIRNEGLRSYDLHTYYLKALFICSRNLPAIGVKV